MIRLKENLQKTDRKGTGIMKENRYELNKQLAQMLKGGVIMDVTTPEQAKIAEEAGACAVMALERIPADIRAAGGVSRMSDPKMIRGIQEAVSIPVMAKCRIGHFVEAQILEAIEIDYIIKRKTERIQATAWPIIQQVYENQGAMYERIMVPITDGKRMYNIPCNLKEAYDTEAKSVVKQWEKVIMLHIIDDDWKENLRQLDELRHSVQNASYEQKDPLLIFKLESVKLWDSMINEMNDRIASILMRGQIPVMEQEQPVQEAAPEQRPQQNYVEQKVDIDAERERAERAAQQAAAHHDTREGAQQVNHTPYRAERMPRPNDPCPCGSGKKFKNCHGRNL